MTRLTKKQEETLNTIKDKLDEVDVKLGKLEAKTNLIKKIHDNLGNGRFEWTELLLILSFVFIAFGFFQFIGWFL